MIVLVNESDGISVHSAMLEGVSYKMTVVIIMIVTDSDRESE